jgi:NTP pyrophosphatase (non-canonical NTP hydrolase)
MAKTLGEMAQESREHHTAKGWRENTGSYDQYIMRIHAEVAEITEALRIRGWDSYTTPEGKPDDAASELADVFIRTIETADVFGFELEPDKRAWDLVEWRPDLDSLASKYPVNWLHDLVGKAWQTQSKESLLAVLRGVVRVCHVYGIDIEAEYERKMAFNWTRPYRHGGKRF